MLPFILNHAQNIASLIGGIAITVLAQQILNKRGLFTYFVNHSLISVSANDMTFGTVQVTWNNNQMTNLFMSTVTLKNESMKDYENVKVCIYSNDTTLLTQKTEVVGTTQICNWTDEFAQKLAFPPNSNPSSEQLQLYQGKREFLIPVMNRGQIVRFYFLNSSKTAHHPYIFTDILHKSVKVKFQTPRNLVHGVEQPLAALMGTSLGLFLVIGLILFIKTLWVGILCAFIYGLFAQIPGAYIVKIYRWFRQLFGG